MKHTILVRMWCLAALFVAGPVGVPTVSYAQSGLLVPPQGEVPASLQLGQSKQVDIGYGFSWKIMRADDALEYVSKGYSWDANRDLLFGLFEDAALAELELLKLVDPRYIKVLQHLKDAKGVVTQSVLTEAETFIRDLVIDEASFEWLQVRFEPGLDFSRDLVALFQYKGFPLASVFCSRTESTIFTTNHGCGYFFTEGDPVVASVGLPYDATVSVLLEPRDGGPAQRVVSGLSLQAHQVKSIPIPSSLFRVGFWRLRLGATAVKDGTFHSDACNFAVLSKNSGSGGGSTSSKVYTLVFGYKGTPEWTTDGSGTPLARLDASVSQAGSGYRWTVQVTNLGFSKGIRYFGIDPICSSIQATDIQQPSGWVLNRVERLFSFYQDDLLLIAWGVPDGPHSDQFTIQKGLTGTFSAVIPCGVDPQLASSPFPLGVAILSDGGTNTP